MAILPPDKQAELKNLIDRVIKNGEDTEMKQRTWRGDTIASESLIDLLLDDIGLVPGPARQATREYLVSLLKEEEENGGIEVTMGDLNTMAINFYDGFYAGKGLAPAYC